MFYIRDVESKKYVYIKKVNGVKKLALTKFKSQAAQFSDKNIKTSFKKIISLFPEKMFWADYKREYDIPLLIKVLFAWCICSIFLIILLICSIPHQNKFTSPLLPSISSLILKNIWEENENLTSIEELHHQQEITSRAIEYFNEDIYISSLLASIKYSIPIHVIYALIDSESDGKKWAYSSYGCIGLTQISIYAIMEYNKKHFTNYTSKDAWGTALNIEIGIWYYNWCINQVKQTHLLGDDLYTSAYIMYNIGYGNYIDSKNTYSLLLGNRVYMKGKLIKYTALNRFLSKLSSCEKIFQ